MFWIWLGAAVIFLIVELGTPVLVFACFVIGSFGAAITSTITESYLIQMAVFVIVSTVLIPLTRPLARKITKESPQKTNVDAMIGQVGIVIKKIDPDADTGQVRVIGQVWQANADGVINEGKKIKVESVSGARLNVLKVEE